MWIRERSSRLKVAVVAGVCAFALTAAGCSGAASDDSPEAPAGPDDSVTLKMLTVQSGGFLEALQVGDRCLRGGPPERDDPAARQHRQFDVQREHQAARLE